MKKTPAVLALIATILASAGGTAFLRKHPNPTLRDVFASCEKGELAGIACCEDMNAVKDWNHVMDQCLPVAPQNHDPGGFRAKEEDDWDKQQAEQLKAMK
jgi:hypothetical protein